MTMTIKQALAAIRNSHIGECRFELIASHVVSCPRRDMDQLIVIIRMTCPGSRNYPAVDRLEAYSCMTNMTTGCQRIEP